MPNYYCTVDDVANWLNIDVAELNVSKVNSLIEMKMDYIDQITRTTWNGNRRVAKEWHTGSITYWRGSFFFGIGIPIYLSYMDIQDVLKVSIFSLSNSEADITSNYGRDSGGWWIDKINGVIYLREWIFPLGGREVYVEYTYGIDYLPGTIKELCILLVAKDIILNDKYYWTIGSNESVVGLKDMINQMNGRIQEIEREYKQLLPARTASRVLSYYVDTTTP